MTTVANDPVAIVTLGLIKTGAAATPPGEPTLSIVAASNTVTATIDGDAGTTNVLAWKTENDSAWTTDNRAGDGDIVVSNLDNDVRYTFSAYSTDGTLISLWAPSQIVLFTSAAAGNPFDDDADANADIQLELYGETVLYLPKGGGSRSIQAIVDREEDAGLVGRSNSVLLEIMVKNSVTEGISSNELDTGGDKITVAVRIGKTARNLVISRKLNEDHGMLELELR